MKNEEINLPTSEVEHLKGKNSDLMRRLNIFLPQMASANQSLQSDFTHDDKMKIDISMIKDGHSDHSDECSDDDDEVSEHISYQNEHFEEKQRQERIEMTFAIGNLDENDPVINLLSNDDDAMNESILDLNSIDGDWSRNKSDTCDENEVGDPLFVIRSTTRN